MRVSNILWVLLLPALAAAAESPPRLKAGEWHVVGLSDGELGELSSGDLGPTCLADQSVLAKFDTLANCSRKEFHTDGSITLADAQCRVPYHAMSFREKVLRLNENDYYLYFHLAYTPPVLQGAELEQSEAMRFAHLKWMGACRKGETPSKMF